MPESSFVRNGFSHLLQAIFLDRDGVINRERADYVKTWDELEFLPGTVGALRQLAALDIPLLVITNQSAIGRGLVTLEAVNDLHERLRARVSHAGGRIDGFYVCPHRPDEGCLCRKPEPGLLLRAAQERQLDLSRCIFVGDSDTDRLAAEAAGCDCILVRSGRNGDRLQAVAETHPGVTLVADLSTAVSTILAWENVCSR